MHWVRSFNCVVEIVVSLCHMYGLAAEPCRKWTAIDVRNAIKKEQVVMICYDADKDHTPTNGGGQHAHWCLVAGCAMSDDENVTRRCVLGDDDYVIAYHGKSMHPGVWKVSTLLKSNSQIMHLNVTQHVNMEHYPTDVVSLDTLCDVMFVIRPMTDEPKS